MKTVDNVILKEVSKIRGKSQCPEEARIYNSVVDFFDGRRISDDSFWERMKTYDDQGVIINRQTRRANSFFFANPLNEPTNNNSTTSILASIFSFLWNTTLYPNYDLDFSLLSERIDSLEQYFDAHLQNQNLTQMPPVKSTKRI